MEHFVTMTTQTPEGTLREGVDGWAREAVHSGKLVIGGAAMVVSYKFTDENRFGGDAYHDGPSGTERTRPTTQQGAQL
jgi:hypothetical protein